MAGQFMNALAGALFLAVERVAGDDQPMQRGAGLGLLLAQRRQLMRGDRLLARRSRLLQRAPRDEFGVLLQFALRLLQLPASGAIIDQRRQRLVLTDLRGDLAIAPGLARLPAQTVGLAVDLLQHVFQTGQILRGGGQAQFRLVAARMQAGDARRLLQNAPPRLRLGRDDLADLALTHQRRRARAGGGVGE